MEEIKSQKDEKQISGKVTIGCSYTIADYIIPKILPQLALEYPFIDISLIRGNTYDILEKIRNHFCDFALIEGWSNYDVNLESSLWMKDELKAICSNKHHLAKKETVTLKELTNEASVYWGKSIGTRTLFIKNFNEIDKATKDFWFGHCTNEQIKTINGETIISNYTPLARKWINNRRSIFLSDPEATKNCVSNSTLTSTASNTFLKNSNCSDITTLNIENVYQEKNHYHVLNKRKYLSKAASLISDKILKYNFE